MPRTSDCDYCEEQSVVYCLPSLARNTTRTMRAPFTQSRAHISYFAQVLATALPATQYPRSHNIFRIPQLNRPAHLANMGIGDAQNLKSEAEILARQSRPQRSSTWVPKTRDWRYATGVIQHDDFDDAPKSRSVWDTLDYDYQGGEERNPHVTDAVQTPKSTGSRNFSASPSIIATERIGYKPMTLPKSGWTQVKRLKRSATAGEVIGVAKYETTALVVRLHFTREALPQVKAILEGSAKSRTPPVSSPNTPATSRTAASIRTPHRLDSIKSLHAFPLFKRAWVDETYDFNAVTVRSKIRPIDRAYDELGANYHWYNDAVPSDAVFPPGVPISAKEISAFYPHHVRWKSVMVRLTKNDYRGPDIMGMQVSQLGADAFWFTATDSTFRHTSAANRITRHHLPI